MAKSENAKRFQLTNGKNACGKIAIRKMANGINGFVPIKNGTDTFNITCVAWRFLRKQ